MRRLIALSAFALLIACGGSTSPAPPSVAGTWTGVTGAQTLSMTIVENSGVVNGSGTITGTLSGTVSLTISGTFTNPTLAVSMASGTFQPIGLTAVLSGKVLTGNLNGSGFTGDVIVLTRP